MPSQSAVSESFANFQRTLAEHGLRRALAGVLALTDFRFIAIYRVEDGVARAVVHYDRQHPEVEQIDAVAESESLCRFVRQTRRHFATNDSAVEPALAAEAVPAGVRAYCGVPIFDDAGHLLGTLCHYDDEPRDTTQIDLELMVLVVSELVRSGTLPPFR